MAAPAYASDLNDIVVPPMVTGPWDAFGGGASGLNQETDYFLIDSDCMSKNAWAGDYRGMVYDNTTDVTIATGDALFVWVTHLTPNSLSTESAGGIRIIMADSSTESTFDEWYVAGSDSVVYDDRWIMAVADPDITPDNNNGATENYSWFGAGANLPVGGPTKGSPFAIAAIRHGREFQCTAGDLANGYATFDGAATYDDGSTRRYGQIIPSKGVYTITGLFVMGTASTAVDFRDSDRTLFVARTPKVQAGFNGFEVRNTSSRVDWTNISITALGTVSKGTFSMVSGADVNFSGCNFVSLSTFTFQSSGSAQNCTWRGCDQITANGADLTGSVVSGYEGAADSSSLIWNVATNPDVLLDGMSFTKGSAATHAIEFGTSSPTSITLRDMTFTDYNVSDGQNDSAIEFLRTSGTVTVTLVNTAQPSIKKDAGLTVNFVTNPVDVTVQALTTTGAAIQDARVFLYATDTAGSLPAEDSVTISNSGTTATVTHTSHGLTSNDKAWIQGASLDENNGVFTVTVTDANTYTYTMDSAPGSSPTGTITSTFVFVNTTTDVNGEATLTKSFTADQSVEGWARKSTTSPLYKQGTYVGTASSSGDSTFTAVLILDE